MVRIKSILSVLAICVALIGYLPLAAYLDPFARWFFPAALAFGCYQQRQGRFLSGRILTPVSILLFVYYASGFTRDNLLPATANLLVVFLGVRMLGEKSGRNYLQIFALALFCLAASSLYNLSALFLVYLLLLLLLLAVSLVILAFHAHDAEIALSRVELKKVLGVSGLMPVAALPILLVLFVLLPRTQYPLWDFLNRGGGTHAGFSEKVQPGAASSVAVAKTVVLRAMTPKLPDTRLYWRGIVLNGFKDNAWIRVPEPKERYIGTAPGTLIRQEIYPEPSSTPYLLALNIPRQISGVRYADAPDVVFKSRLPVDKRIKYEAQSTLSDVIRTGGVDRNFYLKLPERVPPRLLAQGRALARPGLSDEEKLKRLEAFIRTQRIAYATSDLPVGPDSLDAFLFVKKRGNCEFFASSCATLLRLAGVPARLVGGYRGGSYNDMGGYYLVTEDLAHVWVEAYIEGKGWLSVDPTAWSVGFNRDNGVGQKLRMYLDAAGFYWNKAVLTYDLEKQIALLRKAGNKARQLQVPSVSARGLVTGLMWLLTFAATIGWFLRPRVSREERVLKAFLRAVARRYPTVAQEETGLFELVDRVKDPQVKEFVMIYGAALYKDRQLLSEELAKLKEIVKGLSQHRS